MGLLKPKALKVGDTIGVVAPSSWFDRAAFLDGMTALQAAGFKVIHRDDLFAQHRYLAGTDNRRADEFLHFLHDPHVSAIMCARGGYGAQRIIPHLNFKKPKPKWVIGYSDVTVLLNLIQNELGWLTIYGPTIAKHFGKHAPRETMDRLITTLTQPGPLGALPLGKTVVVKPGKAKGHIVGGCLTLVQMGIGTSYDIRTKDSILFLEDRGEKLYEIDRMMLHLKHAGKLKGVNGIVFGSMELHPQEEQKQHELIPLLQDVLADFEGPVVANFPAGHTDPFVPLPMGAKSTLSTSPLEWKITESICT